jgi:hypothetical protein
MHEELFLNLLKQYQDAGLSLDRIIKDSRFKALPLDQRVELLKEHGHTIRGGTKVDSQMIKDFAWGGLATSVMLYSPIMSTIGNLKNGIDYGGKVRAAQDEGIPVDSVPKPRMVTDGYEALVTGVGGAVGLGLAAPKFYNALSARSNMKMVKKWLKEEPGSNTQEDAINVISRS